MKLFQLWLFHQHNAVTQRVWVEETKSGNLFNSPGTVEGTSVNPLASSDTGTTGSRANTVNNNIPKTEETSTALRAELWPSAVECSTCMDTAKENSYKSNTTAILEYLHRAYAI